MRILWFCVFILLSTGLSAAAVDIDLEYVDDITGLTDQCFIRAIKLDLIGSAGDVEDNSTVFEGALELAAGRHIVRLATEAEAARLWIDPNGAGNLVRTEWERILTDGSLLASVRLTLTYEDGAQSPYRLFLMWNAFLPTVMTFCRNSYREGTMEVKGRRVRLAVIDADTDGRYDRLDGGVVLIDTDGDGELLATGDSHERYLLSAPFSVDGISYRVSSVDSGGRRMQIEELTEPVAPKPPLLPGFHAPEFTAVDASGATVSLAALRGRVVVLDFWAGWCSPCVAEIPTLKRLVSEYGEEDVIVLGINLDRSEGAFGAAVADHEIDWPQIYDGPDGPIGALYRIDGIPMTYVIDPEGRIVARGLRGEALLDAVAGETETE